MNTEASKDPEPVQPTELRRRAEDRLRAREAQPAEATSVADARALVHELQVHQIELEMQNEELQRARMEAEEASEKYFDLFDFAPAGYFLWDRDGRILEINLAGAALLGLERGVASQKRFGQFVAAEFRSAFANFLARVLATDAKQTCEVIIQSEGSTVWVLVEGIAAQDRRGPERHCRAAVMDVSQQKRADELAAANEALKVEMAARERAEEARHESEQRFPALVTATSDVVFWLSPDFSVMRYYQGSEFIPGTDVPNGSWLDQYVFPEDLPQVMAVITEATRTKNAFELEHRVRRVDGSVGWTISRAIPLLDARGEITEWFGCASDITARKQAEAELERLRVLLSEGQKIAHLGSFEYVVATDETIWSDEEFRIFGLEPGTRSPAYAELLQKHFHPDDAARVDEHFRAAMRNDSAWEIEFRIVHPNGQVRHVQNVAQPYFDTQGKLLKYIGATLDITERKQAEVQSYEMTQWLHALMQAIPIGAVLVDARGGTIAANPAFEQIWGGPRPPARSVDDYAAYQAWWAETGEPLQPGDWASARAVQHGESVVGQLLRIRRFDGSDAIVLNSAAPIRDADGRITGSAVAIQDITAAQETERRLAVAVSGAQIGLFQWNIATGEVLWNRQHARLFGLETSTTTATTTTTTTVAQSFTYDDWASRVHPEDFPQVEAELRRSVAERIPLEVDYRIVWPDGSLHWMATRAVVEQDVAGQARRMVGLVMDITQRKVAEDHIRASLREKEVLLKEIHHRVKNNMQVVSSLIGLQADRLQDDAMRAVLRDVMYRVRSMALIHEKLYQSADFARVEFSDYTESLLNFLWRAHGIASSGVRLALDLEPVTLSVNVAVPCGLILNELATNALKHAFRGRAGGEVSVSLCGGEDGQVRFRVRDNGVGFPPGFDWREAHSMGLGLVQILAKQLDATVEFRSGEGTECTLTFGERNAQEHEQP